MLLRGFELKSLIPIKFIDETHPVQRLSTCRLITVSAKRGWGNENAKPIYLQYGTVSNAFDGLR
jgi:hypothetical protein